MLLYLEDFFNNGKVKIQAKEGLERSDLFRFLEKQYGEIIFIDDAKTNCFMSLEKDSNGDLWLVEKVFYHDKMGEELGCFIPKILKFLCDKEDYIWDSTRGNQLARSGFVSLDIEDEDSIEDVLKKAIYDVANLDKTAGYRITNKYSDVPEPEEIPMKQEDDSKIRVKSPFSPVKAYNTLEELFREVNTFGILPYINHININFMRYPEGTVINPHSDVDMASFSNIVLFSPSCPSVQKTTQIGTWNWHKKIFRAAMRNKLDDVDLPENEGSLVPTYNHKCSSDKALMFNFFNPRFYHYVPATKGGACYTGLVFGSFRELMDIKDIEW